MRFPTTLIDSRDQAPTAGWLHDRLSLNHLFDAEEQWCVARVALLRALFDADIRSDAAEWPQSIHWNWAMKAAAVFPSSAGAVQLLGIEAQEQWQGLLLAIVEGRRSRMNTPGHPLVYVDFLESAPWNWVINPLERRGRFAGIGTRLMHLAVGLSLQLGFEGRVGLHALPQAISFYTRRCGMTSLGPDAMYNDLHYFEMSEIAAKLFVRNAP